jgi:hypothetical protein
VVVSEVVSVDEVALVVDVVVLLEVLETVMMVDSVNRNTPYVVSQKCTTTPAPPLSAEEFQMHHLDLVLVAVVHRLVLLVLEVVLSHNKDLPIRVGMQLAVEALLLILGVNAFWPIYQVWCLGDAR